MKKTETVNAQAASQPGVGSSGLEWREVIQDWEPAFFGDNNRAVKNIQRETCAELSYELFVAARQRYLLACTLVGVDTRLAELARQVERHRRPFLGRVYRMIAKFYRFALVGEQQVDLPFGEGTSFDSQREAWQRYFRHEVKRLVETDEFTTGVIRSVVHQLTPIGDAAEAHVVDLLSHRYGRFHLQRRLELLRLNVSLDELDGWRFVEDVDWDQIALDPRVRPNLPD